MLRNRLALLLAVLLVAPSLARADKLNDPVKRALNTEISNVSLANTSLADAIDYLRDITGANINVHWRILEAAKITKDTPVNVKLRAVPMRKALQLILEEAGAGTPLTYYLDQGVIEITTTEAADAKMITRVYDVGDLIMEIPDFAGPDLSLTSSTSGSSGSGQNGSSGSGSSGGLFGNSTGSGSGSDTKEKGATAQERGNQLVSTITSTVRPEVWKDNGGAASIVFFKGRLIVTAPRSVQEMIGGPVD